MKKLLIGVLLVIQFNLAYAADFPTLPYTFVAKQLISAAKVMANYNALRNGIIDGTKKINVAELWINGIKRINSSGVLVEDNIYKIPGEYATLALAVEAIGSATANIEIDTVTVETVGTEIPANVIELKFGALGKIGSAVTVTFNGQYINAPNNVQIFGDSLTVTGNISNTEVYGDWFGAESGDTIEDSTAFNRALEIGKGKTLEIIDDGEVYLLNASLIPKEGTTIKSSGKAYLKLQNSSGIPSASAMIQCSYDNITVKNLKINGNYTNQVAALIIHGIRFSNNAKNGVVDNVDVENFVDSSNQSHGFSLNRASYIRISNSRSSTANNNLIVFNASSHNVFENMIFENTIDSEAVSFFADEGDGGFNSITNATFKNCRQSMLIQRSKHNAVSNLTIENSGGLIIRSPGNVISNVTIKMGAINTSLGDNGVGLLCDTEQGHPTEVDEDLYNIFTNINIDINGQDIKAVNISASANPPKNAIFNNLVVVDSTKSKTTSTNGITIGSANNIKFNNSIVDGIGGNGWSIGGTSLSEGVYLNNCIAQNNGKNGVIINNDALHGGSISGTFKNNSKSNTLNYTGISISPSGNYDLVLDDIQAYDDQLIATQADLGISVGVYTGTLNDGNVPPDRGLMWRKGMTTKKRNLAIEQLTGFAVIDELEYTVNGTATATNNIPISSTTNIAVSDNVAILQNNGTFHFDFITTFNATTITISDNVTATSAGKRLKIWRWGKLAVLEAL